MSRSWGSLRAASNSTFATALAIGSVGVLALTSLGGCGDGVHRPNVGESDATVDSGNGNQDGTNLGDSWPDGAGPGDTANDTTSDVPDGGAVASTAERKTLHRLNRVEYQNTLRDLFFGMDVATIEDFPAPDHGAGFDNIADVLSLSALTVELFERSAAKVVTDALNQPLAEPAFLNFEAESAETVKSAGGDGGAFWNLWSNGTVSAVATLPEAGTYSLSARVACNQAGPEVCQASLLFDGLDVQVFDITGTNSAPQVINVVVSASAGVHTIAVSFNNDFYDEVAGLDQNMLVDWVRIEGPTDLPPGVNPTRDAVIGLCTASSEGDQACLQEIATKMGKRAWRRPIETAEVTSLMALTDAIGAAGGDWNDKLSMMLQAIIVSPHFLFRVELDTPDPTSLLVHPLTDYELASRLAYFLWSSSPDTELMTLADSGQLQNPATLNAQVDRMLQDSAADSLIDNFAGQWLFIRAIPEKAPDAWVYPAFDDALRDAQETEMAMFARRYLFEDRSMLDMLTDPQSFINKRLADHYGIPSAGMTEAFNLVDLSGTGRQGLLGKSGLMAVLAHPTRTSPVKRGVWVLEHMMCDGPDDPPPGVEGLLDEQDPTGKTLRDMMDIHRQDPYCASCHDTIDPIGLGLENYDGIGAWRELDNELPVDASGVLPGGQEFNGPNELAAALLQDPRLKTCMVRKAFIYAMGRDVHPVDADFLASIENEFVAGQHRFAALAKAIVTSDAFRMRRGELTPPDSSAGGGQP